jgi:hypothetical protein
MWKKSDNKCVRDDGAKVYPLPNGKWTAQDGSGDAYTYSSAGGNNRGYFWKDAERAMASVDRNFPVLGKMTTTEMASAADKARKTKSQRSRTATRSKARLGSRTDETKEAIVKQSGFACVSTKTGYEISIGDTVIVIESPKSILIMQNNE